MLLKKVENKLLKSWVYVKIRYTSKAYHSPLSLERGWCKATFTPISSYIGAEDEAIPIL